MKRMLVTQGFTLVEALLCLSILAIGFLGLLAFQGSLSDSLVADQQIIATNLARETMERIIAQRDCNETGCGYSATLTSINTTNTYDQNPVSGFPGFIIDSTAVEVDPDDDGGTDDFLDAQSGSGYARVTVTASWNNASQSIQLVTLITN